MPEPIDSKEDIFLPQSDRLQILSAEEYEQLWGLPRFSQYERHLLLPQLGLRNTDLPIREHLSELRINLDESFERVNQRI